MGKPWVLDTETKGTGANMVPLEKVERKQGASKPARRQSNRRKTGQGRDRSPGKRPARGSASSRQKAVSALPPGHVRKKATGEIGQVRSVDPKAGTASVRWLRRGATSTVPLSAITRR